LFDFQAITGLKFRIDQRVQTGLFKIFVDHLISSTLFAPVILKTPKL